MKIMQSALAYVSPSWHRNQKNGDNAAHGFLLSGRRRRLAQVIGTVTTAAISRQWGICRQWTVNRCVLSKMGMELFANSDPHAAWHNSPHRNKNSLSQFGNLQPIPSQSPYHPPRFFSQSCGTPGQLCPLNLPSPPSRSDFLGQLAYQIHER